jgi:hypothetical protein
MKKEVIVIGLVLLAGAIWWYNKKPSVSIYSGGRTPAPGEIALDHTGLVMDLTGGWVTPEEFARRQALRDPNKDY